MTLGGRAANQQSKMCSGLNDESVSPSEPEVKFFGVSGNHESQEG